MPIPTHFFGKALTHEQKHYYEVAQKKKVIIVNAPSGTGKTWLATAIAKEMGKKMHYIFSPVQEGSLGFLPGGIKEKTEPYLLPLKDALVGIGEKPEDAIFDELTFKPHTWVYPSPHTFWRGGNIENSVVIIDEAQNFTTHELRKTLTRLHDSNKVFVIGSTLQCDLKDPSKSGFIPYIKHTQSASFAEVVSLTIDFRGQICKWADSITV